MGIVSQGPAAYPLTLASSGSWRRPRCAQHDHRRRPVGDRHHLAVLLVPSQPGAAMTGMRLLILMALSGPMLLLASWAEHLTANPGDLIARIGARRSHRVRLVAAWCRSMSAPPLRHAGPLAIAMLVWYNLPCSHLGSIQVTMWPGQQTFYAAILVAGGWTAVAEGSWRSCSGRQHALAYAALADMGLVLWPGDGTVAGVRRDAARGSAPSASWRWPWRRHPQQSLDGDDIEHLRGDAPGATLLIATAVGAPVGRFR